MNEPANTVDLDPAVLLAVRNLVSVRTNVPLDKIDANTSLGSDLGVDGEDASELLNAYANEFRVDLLGFEFHKYFGPEGIEPLAFFLVALRGLMHSLSGRDRRTDRANREITIAHLVRCASAHRWFEVSPIGRPRRRDGLSLIQILIAGVFAGPVFVAGAAIATAPFYFCLRAIIAYAQFGIRGAEPYLKLALLFAALLSLWYLLISRRFLRLIPRD